MGDVMLLPTRRKQNAKVPWTCRIRPEIAEKIRARAVSAGRSESDATSALLETILELEARLGPFQPLLRRFMAEERLTFPEALTKALWLGVEFNPTEVKK